MCLPIFCVFFVIFVFFSEAMSEDESEHSADEVVQEQPKNDGRWFVAPEKLVELAAKPASKSATFGAQNSDDTELIFFTFPQNVRAF